jgi:N-acylglucosamine-6-phosphate 2-epimerase
MYKIIEKINKKIIISCQASSGEPIYEENCLLSIIKSVINGGASGLRLAGCKDIEETRKISDIPVIGITKPDPLPCEAGVNPETAAVSRRTGINSFPENWKEIVYITPTFEDAKKISQAGADIIAIDGTSRKRPKENLAELIEKIHNELKKPVMTDCATVEEGLMCRLLGADIISTTLSGYTQETLNKNKDEPDFELLESLVKIVESPVILEGRIWTVEHAKKAFELGAYAVVIGSAVTRPQLITKRFIDAVK